jgi:hypothetical protein
MSIKKQYEDVINFLEANSNKKVNTIIDEVIAMVSTKSVQKAFYKDEETNEVIAIRCYYFKRWMLLDEVDFGAKKHSPSGFNSMCKVGANQWAKQQREAKQQTAELLTKVASGDVEASDIVGLQVGIEEERKLINYDACPTSYETLEEALEAYSKK